MSAFISNIDLSVKNTPEAALRMLLNNLDPDVAERPEELIVYGGRGKAARNRLETKYVDEIEHDIDTAIDRNITPWRGASV